MGQGKVMKGWKRGMKGWMDGWMGGGRKGRDGMGMEVGKLNK